MALCFLVLLRYALVRRKRSSARIAGLPLPPGPSQLPFIGNLFDFPQQPEEWKGFAALGRLYGPVVCMRILNKDIIVLNSMKAATDLLEKRNALYSDRPRFPMACEVAGLDWILAFMPYGSEWRRHRRALHPHMNETAAKSLAAMQEVLTARFLRKILAAPEDWSEALEWLAGATIVRAMLGVDVADKNDPLVKLNKHIVGIVIGVASPGVPWAVDWLPFLNRLPSWLPGMGFKRQAAIWKNEQLRCREESVAHVKRDMAAGTAVTSIASKMLADEDADETVVTNVINVAYLAGNDTTLGAMRAFFHAMVLHPVSQREAQTEIDQLLGGARLLSLEDRPTLPYLEALVLETMRMYPVAPLALPHCVTENDEYEGMAIPKGATVIPNTWAILNDPAVYPEPETFRPERFLKARRLDPLMPDPRNAYFGYGRRMCPGQYFAYNEVWLLAATTLACFDILPVKDAAGKDVLPSRALSSGLVSSVSKFPCRLIPRDRETSERLLSLV
ncbi:cytochrome P450 [Exidia glandulosa HHB12029]|uniref:Cytochrome P450 n=1 Tax=Exidia glandulosa HHB12029 TaxID=1314781 RepID=A0A165Q266_EXIGL|nr:cytochrome P450 [Exidia glandulosa HHB12029]